MQKMTIIQISSPKVSPLLDTINVKQTFLVCVQSESLLGSYKHQKILLSVEHCHFDILHVGIRSLKLDGRSRDRNNIDPLQNLDYCSEHVSIAPKHQKVLSHL